MNAVRVRVGGESYAVAVDHVTEVVELGKLTPVPGTHRSVLGVRNLRGEVLPVFDLAAILELGADSPQSLVVVEHGSLRAGLAVDEVTDVGPLPPAAEETQSKLLAGAVLDHTGLVGVVDVERLFAALASEDA
jgi:purine-binding chemotaxis protein CheW